MSLELTRERTAQLVKTGGARYKDGTKPEPAPAAAAPEPATSPDVADAFQKVFDELAKMSATNRAALLTQLRSSEALGRALESLLTPRPERWVMKISKRDKDGKVAEVEFTREIV